MVGLKFICERCGAEVVKPDASENYMNVCDDCRAIELLMRARRRREKRK